MRFGPSLVTLNRLAEVASTDNGLADEGLILHERLEPGGYSCTPINSVAFASTGGDGVHFSLVDLGDGPAESSPVVMTVPMAFGDDLRSNWVLGADLREFLALGFHGGWFTLEQLAYDPAWPAELARATTQAASQPVTRLAAELDLRPWAEVEARLRQLQDQLGPQLDIPDET